MKNLAPNLLIAVFAVATSAMTSSAANNLAEAKKEYADRLQELLTCEDGLFEAKRAEMLAFVQNPGITNGDQHVEFLLATVQKDGQRVFEKPDCWALAEKVASTDASGQARSRFLNMKASNFNSYFNSRDFPGRRWSPEARLEFAAELMKDAGYYSLGRIQKLEALKALGRNDEFVAFANEEFEKVTRPADKAELCMRIAELHKGAARRYYDKPEPSELKKAIAAVDRLLAIENIGKDRICRRAAMLAAEASFQLEDFAKTKDYVAKAKAFDNDKFTIDCADLLGKVAFAEEDYGAAADLWLECIQNKGRIDNAQLVRALYGADRKKEAIPFLEQMSKTGNKYRRDFYGYALKELLEDGVISLGDTQ